jgi:3-oxoacyl-[acyl-carrier-protein] synthase II
VTAEQIAGGRPVRRVAISGAGSVNALGMGVDAFARGLKDARCAIQRLSLFDPSPYRSPLAAEVRELPLPDWMPAAVRRHASRSDLFALIAAEEALSDAGLKAADRRSVGVILGASTGGMFEGEECYRSLLGDNEAGVKSLLGAPVFTSTDLLAQVFECYGPRLTVSTACSSGNNALGIAADWIRSGRAEVVLCGGVDSLCQMTFSGFNALQAVDTVPCRPFDRDRAGLTLGEGAAVFVLEDAERAGARGATPWAEFLGYGVSADAHHMTQPLPDGASALMAARRALRESGVGAEEIDYVNAHGTGTPLNDVAETRILKALLGEHVYRVPVSSTKSITGHCLAAAGAIEALACLIALRDSFVPATVNLETPDPECDLDYVPKVSRRHDVRTALSNSYGFGGNNTTIVLRRGNRG